LARAAWTGGAFTRGGLVPTAIPELGALAELSLAALPPRELAIAGLCAVLGSPILASTLTEARDQPIAHPSVALPDHGASDTAAALAALVRHGILHPTGRGFTLRHPRLGVLLLERLPTHIAQQHHAAALRRFTAAGRDDAASLAAIV